GRGKGVAAKEAPMGTSPGMILVGPGILLVVALSAEGAVLCSTGGGTLKVRDACRPRETPVDPVALGLQGPPGPPGPSEVFSIRRDGSAMLGYPDPSGHFSATVGHLDLPAGKYLI